MGTLIKDVGTFKDVVGGVQQSIEWETIKGTVRTAENLYLIPVLGDEFYNELTAYTGTDINVKTLIERLQQAAGYYTHALIIPQMVASFGDGGVTVNAQNGSQAVAKWMNVQLIESSMGLADKALESAIQYLDKFDSKKVGNVYVFKTWRDSETYALSKSLFIPTATILTEHFPVAKGSHRVFLSMLQYLKRAEKTFILPLLGKAFYTDLKAKIANDTIIKSAEEEETIELVRTALAHKAFAMGLPYLNFNADFQLISETDGVKNQDPATRGKLDGMKVDCDETAKIYANKLKAYIDSVASATKLIVYFGSTIYTPSVKNEAYKRKPIPSDKSFVSF
jgi:hypothetical protein